MIMIAKNSKIYLIGTVLMLLISGCWDEKPVTITKEYVVNPYWDKVDNSFTVTKMELKDSSKTIDLKDPSESELYHGLIEDTSFSYTANVKYNGVEYSERKVYFNRDNGFSWGKLNDRHSNYKQDTIGELESDTWYLLGGLGEERTLYYVYLDSSDSLNVFKVSTMTNY